MHGALGKNDEQRETRDGMIQFSPFQSSPVQLSRTSLVC